MPFGMEGDFVHDPSRIRVKIVPHYGASRKVEDCQHTFEKQLIQGYPRAAVKTRIYRIFMQFWLKMMEMELISRPVVNKENPRRE
jgi:hypothetical protein